MGTDSAVTVTDNAHLHRYEIRVDGALAGFAAYRLAAGQVVFTHTEVDPSYEGHGLGSQLAAGAIRDVRARDLEIVAICPFIADYMRRHPEA